VKNMKDRGIGTAIIVIVIVAAAAAAGGFMVMSEDGGVDEVGTGTTDENEGTMSTNATVRLHDAETIDLSKEAENYMPSSMSGVDINVSGTVTVNNFSATNVTVKLHNQDSDQWTTLVNEDEITDLTKVNEYEKEISPGTYDKISWYIDNITVDIQWTEIDINATVDFSEFGGSGTEEFNQSIDNGKIEQSVAIKKEFTENFSKGISITSEENQIFDVETGAPFNLPFSADAGGLSSTAPEAGLEESRMQAKALGGTTSETDEETDEDKQTSNGSDYSGTWESSGGNYSGTWEFTVDDSGNVSGSVSGDAETSLSGTFSEGTIKASGTAYGGAVTWSGSISSDGTASGTWEMPNPYSDESLTGTWSGSESS